MQRQPDMTEDIQLAALAHDLRTPMCVAAGAAQMALEAGGDVSLQLRQILQAVNMMDRMLTMMGGDARQREECFGAEMLRDELLTMVSQRAYAKRQKLSIDLSAIDGHMLETDRAALSRLLINLLGNAIKYTQEGGEITLRAQTASGRWRKDWTYIRFVVADNGPGISRAFMQHMFKPYSRANDTAEAPGQGLGLSVAWDMAKRLGGTIHVRSERGRGTVFAVNVPVRMGKEKRIC